MKIRIDEIPLHAYSQAEGYTMTWSLDYIVEPWVKCVTCRERIPVAPIDIDYEPLFVGPEDAPADPKEYSLTYVIVSPAGLPVYEKTIVDLTEYAY